MHRLSTDNLIINCRFFYEIWLVKTNKRRTDMDTKKQNPVAVCRMHQEEWNPDPE